MLKRNGLRRSVNDAHEQRPGIHIHIHAVYRHGLSSCRKLSCIPSSANQSSTSEFAFLGHLQQTTLELPVACPSDEQRNVLTWQTTNASRCACRDLTTLSTRDSSFYVGSDKMISDSQSDADDTEDDRTQPQTAANSSGDAGIRQRLSAVAVDSCEACHFVAPRDSRFALVPFGHQRFCESCANAVHDQSRSCPPLCRTPITMVCVCTNWTYSKVNTVSLQ